MAHKELVDYVYNLFLPNLTKEILDGLDDNTLLELYNKVNISREDLKLKTKLIYAINYLYNKKFDIIELWLKDIDELKNLYTQVRLTKEEENLFNSNMGFTILLYPYIQNKTYEEILEEMYELIIEKRKVEQSMKGQLTYGEKFENLKSTLDSIENKLFLRKVRLYKLGLLVDETLEQQNKIDNLNTNNLEILELQKRIEEIKKEISSDEEMLSQDLRNQHKSSLERDINRNRWTLSNLEKMLDDMLSNDNGLGNGQGRK